MYETEEELDELQQLLDRSFASSSEHLQSIMTPPRRLDARRLVAELTDVAVLNIATVTARGEPRISAVDGHFLHARWHFTTAGGSPKARQLHTRPAISAAFTPRDGFGVFCHGTATFLEIASPAFQELEAHWIRSYGQSPQEMGPDIAYVRIEPAWLVAFAMTSEEMAAYATTKAERAAANADRPEPS
jgi:Pyridoxamine 5'-phosphate oxidase